MELLCYAYLLKEPRLGVFFDIFCLFGVLLLKGVSHVAPCIMSCDATRGGMCVSSFPSHTACHVFV